MKKSIALLFPSLLVTSLCAFSADVSEFSVRGVTPGMDVQEACVSLIDDFPLEPGLYAKVGQPERSYRDSNWRFSVKYNIRKTGNSDGCRGAFRANDHDVGGAMTWADSIEVFQNSGAVYAVKNSQTLAAGDNIESCHVKRKSTMDALVSKYGEPTYLHGEDPAENKDYRHLIWDYSKSPDARFGDEDYEIYQVYIGCDIWSDENPFGQMQLQSEIHSGNVFTTHAATAKTGTTFEPAL